MLFLTTAGYSQILEPVKWKFEKKDLSGEKLELRLIAQIEKDWHVYSQDVPANGPVPTKFSFKQSDNYKLIGEVEGPEPAREYDENFDMEVGYHSGETVFRQEVKVLTDKPFNLEGSLEFMTCDDSRCLPPKTIDFEFAVNGGASTASEEDKSQDKKEDEALFNPEEVGGDKSQEGETVSASKDTKGNQSSDANTSGISSGKEKRSLLGFFFFSVLAGLAAIFTPCVFPMIPMTVTFFMHNKESKAKGKIQAMIYGLSIIIIYTVVGTIVAVAFGASFANWLSTHWLPNILFFLVFMFFAASFLGLFEITLPSWLINKSDKQADKGGNITGPFFMAFTLVLVSFSCTGPLVGAILVESAGGEFTQPIIGMLGFSAAFALPFTLFAFFPSWLSNMPKSGGWLNSVKVVLGLLEMALGFKFLSVADQTYHWGLLDREIYIAIWIVIFTIIGFYLLGKITFKGDSEVKHVTVPRLALSIISFTFVVYLLPGMIGAPLKGLSGYLPPQKTHDFDVNAIVRENLRVANYSTSSGSGEQVAQCTEPKYDDILSLPHGLNGFFDYEQALSCAKKRNKPIFIDFTGHGCVNCREMEANVWSDPRVLKRLKEDYVVTALYVDDKTKLPKDEWVKSSYDGKVKKTIGGKYASFQITKFGVNAQPYYVLLDHNGEMLVEPRAYDLDVGEFVDFLDKGVEEFKERNSKVAQGTNQSRQQ
ncbi:MAG: thioredoxin family protein [Bacteroidales bacterium]|nr:thioredoxin family protein [Bacteroidales bacterium]MCF8333523.1 thioredoxin family protein [Bacteroidales bacterium]